MRTSEGRVLPRGRRVLAVTAAAACLLGTAPMASAAARPATDVTFRVTTTADAHDPNPGDGHCADASGQCTLRAAIEEAGAAAAGTDISISVPAGRYLLTLGTLTLGARSAPVSMTIRGTGAGGTVISAGDTFRVMRVTASATVVLDGLVITDGNAGQNGFGGGVLSRGTLTITGTAVAGNRAGAGGGLDNSGGSLVVTHSRIQANRAENWGGGGIQNGGIHDVPGSVLVVSSSVTGNTSAANAGGGIFNGVNGHPPSAGLAAAAPRPLCPRRAPGGCAAARVPAAAGPTLTVLDSNVSGNHADGDGGGIAVYQGVARVIGSVIEDNTASASGGGLEGVTEVRDSTISGNRADSGGGILAGQGTITASTVNANHAASYGGAAEVAGNVAITLSTFAGNTAGTKQFPHGVGAAFEVFGGSTLTMSDSTLTGNRTADAQGGAISDYGGAMTLSFDTISGRSGSINGGGYIVATGTILASRGPAPDCTTRLHETAGYNLASDSSCGLSRPTDLASTDAELGPLNVNGGPTQTVALLPGSPAIDAGGLPSTSGCPLTDQRGKSRPWGPACDIGAFELHYDD